MKTAIIKTNFWKEDRVFELTPDVRYFYLCLLTNPERNTTPAFRCSDRLISAYTGYNLDTISLCRNALIDKKFIAHKDGWYVLNNQDYVEPTKGKLSKILYDKHLEEMPENIRDLLRSNSGATHEYKDKDNNKDKDIDKSKETFSPSDEAKKFFSMVEENGKELQVFVETVSEKTSIPPRTIFSEIKKFSDYWSEKTKSGKKFRWELEKTFEVQRRLNKWFQNAAQWSKEKSKGKQIV